MKKQYQIDKQRAVNSSDESLAERGSGLQLVIPLKEVLDLVQRGLMNLALRTFTRWPKTMMDREVTALVGPKNQANPDEGTSGGVARLGYCVVGGQKFRSIGRGCATYAKRKCRSAATS